MLGNWTQGGRMKGADESTVLWHIVVSTLRCDPANITKALPSQINFRSRDGNYDRWELITLAKGQIKCKKEKNLVKKLR